jgi:hypothetical protein
VTWGTKGAPDDVTAAIITLQRRFPGSSVWFGHHTFRWWAVMPWAGWWVLLEAATPTELAGRMAGAHGSAGLSGVIGPADARQP